MQQAGQTGGCTTLMSAHVLDTIRYDTRCYFNVRSKADISQLKSPQPLEKALLGTYLGRHGAVCILNVTRKGQHAVMRPLATVNVTTCMRLPYAGGIKRLCYPSVRQSVCRISVGRKRCIKKVAHTRLPSVGFRN